MTEAVDLALLRGAFVQLRQFCGGIQHCESCPLYITCGICLEFESMYEFAECMIRTINYQLGFAAKEASE